MQRAPCGSGPGRDKTTKHSRSRGQGRHCWLEPGQHLMADLSIDSPKALQLLMDIEETLEIEIPDDDAARFERVGDLVGYVVDRVAAGADRHGAGGDGG